MMLMLSIHAPGSSALHNKLLAAKGNCMKMQVYLHSGLNICNLSGARADAGATTADADWLAAAADPPQMLPGQAT